MQKTYADMFGKEAKVEVIHGGLECGIFYGKIEGLDAVSFGPDIRDIHTPNEKLSISSAKRMWDYLLKVLEALK
jgi:dipeptidase D